MSRIENAIRIALETHIGQTDKAGAPYILHPLRVMLSMDDDIERQVAVLHDVVEDGDITPDMLRSEGFSEEVCSAVTLLSKKPGDEYMDYLNRIAGNPVARKVKMADLTDNMNLDRIENPTQKDMYRLEKYRKAMAFFKGEK